MTYESANEVKSSFEDVYCAPTPHGYFGEMNRLGYEIGEQAKPYFHAAARLLHQQLGKEDPVRLMDLGCSYGVGAALLNHRFSFSELADFFSDEASENYRECVEETRELIASKEAEPSLECVGADSSAEAIHFAVETGLLEAGIARNLEDGDQLDSQDVAVLEQCNLLTSTGAIGYVGHKTLTPFLELLGEGLNLSHGPYTVVTILRMFDPEPIARTFSKAGYKFVRVPGICLRQRAFDGDRELNETLDLLHRRGVDPKGRETEGHLYADLFAAAPEKDLDALVNCLQQVDHKLKSREHAVAGA